MATFSGSHGSHFHTIRRNTVRRLQRCRDFCKQRAGKVQNAAMLNPTDATLTKTTDNAGCAAHAPNVCSFLKFILAL